MLTCGRLAVREAVEAAGPARLRACPFCGGAAVIEPHSRLADAVRIACADEGCGVRPRTEYLLAEFMAELETAWNLRPAS